MLNIENSFFEKIKEKGDDFSPKQVQLAKYLIDNYKSAAFQNISQIAKEADVSEATVVRLATFLEYSGFPEMLEDLQKIVQYELNAYQNIRHTYKGEQLKELNILETVVSNEQRNVENLLENIAMRDLKKAVDSIEKSKQIIVIGFYASTYLAQYLGYTLGKVKGNVRIINKDSMDLHNLMLDCNKKTTVIIFSFPRYPQKLLRLGEVLKKKGATVIGITDSLLSPLKAVSHQMLVVPLRYISFTDPCCPILVLSQAIVMEYISRNSEAVEENLKQFDEYVEKMKYFS